MPRPSGSWRSIWAVAASRSRPPPPASPGTPPTFPPREAGFAGTPGCGGAERPSGHLAGVKSPAGRRCGVRVSYGFRPGRRAHDAIAEIHYFCSRSYEWVVEGDIKACFDEISHSALGDRVRRRIGDKRILGLVKAFLKAGILGEDGAERDTNTGTPQGGILSPLLSNIALSVLDEPFAEAWAKVTPRACETRRRKGLANYRLIRYADDFVVLVAGTRVHAESLRGESAAVLGTMGLSLSDEKTRIAHIDEGF